MDQAGYGERFVQKEDGDSDTDIPDAGDRQAEGIPLASLGFQ